MLLIFGKTVIKKLLVAKNTCFYYASNAGLSRSKPLINKRGYSRITRILIYEIFWVFYPDNIFLVDLYHETLGPRVNMGSYPFPFGIKISLLSMRNPIILVARDQASIPGVNRVLSSKKLWMFFVCKWKFSEKHTFFSRSFKTVISSTNSGRHCLSRKCRTYTFNNFSLAKWDSRNGGDLFGRANIDTVKSCMQLLKIVLLYRGHLHKELCPGIFRYSKERIFLL